MDVTPPMIETAPPPGAPPPGAPPSGAHTSGAHTSGAHTSGAPGAGAYAQARMFMVDSQVRPNKVTHGPLLDAMRLLPRERFVPAAMAARAYADEDVPLGHGRVLMEPMVFARLLQLALPRRGERALVVAAGPGYGAAVLAALGLIVTAVEQNPALAAAARDALRQTAPGVRLIEGPLAAGFPDGAPYDLILIEGAVVGIPESLLPQLCPADLTGGAAGGGRLVTVLTRARRGVAVIAEAAGGRFRERPAFDCATPAIPELLPPAAFEF